MGRKTLFSTKFLVVFFLFIAAAAYLIRKALDAPDGPGDIDEVVAELVPLVDDPRRFARHLRQYLRKRRIRGRGTVSGLPRAGNETLVLPVAGRVTVEEDGAAREVDIRIDLSFWGADAPTEVKTGDDVEFTGIIIDVRPRGDTLLIEVEISELSYIGREPRPDEYPHDENPPMNPTAHKRKDDFS
jgi:hypothetical protein